MTGPTSQSHLILIGPSSLTTLKPHFWREEPNGTSSMTHNSEIDHEVRDCLRIALGDPRSGCLPK